MSSSESIDSDEGIRFKTDNVRNKSSSHYSTPYKSNLRNTSHKSDYKHHRTDSRSNLRDNSPKRHLKSGKSRSRTHSTTDHQNQREYDRSRCGSSYPSSSSRRRESDSFRTTSNSSPKRERKQDRYRSKCRDKYSSKEKAYESYSSSSRKRSKSPVLGGLKTKEYSRSHSSKKELKGNSTESISSSRSRKKLRNIEDDSNDSDSSDMNETSPAFPKLQKKDEIPKLKEDSSLFPQSEENMATELLIGPALPPRLQDKKKDKHSTIDQKLTSYPLRNESDSNSDTEDGVIGPDLPSHLQKDYKCSENDAAKLKTNPNLDDNGDLSGKEHINGSVLSPKQQIKKSSVQKIVGPALPPHLQNKQNEEDEHQTIGPTLPPNFHERKQDFDPLQLERTREKIIGPFIPSHLQVKLRNEISEESELNIYNQEAVEQEDEEIIGPVPSTSKNMSKTQLLLEERALQMKLDSINPKDSDTTVREEWMLELPSVQAANLGFGSRQFRKNAAPDLSDRSTWTDTPEEKEAKKVNPKGTGKKVDLKREAELEQIKKRDKEQEKMIEKLKKKKNRDKSLLDLHQDNLKKKKKETLTSNERRPFNRDTDLQVNRFDEAQKKAVYKKAQLLNTRFSSGESKFL